MASSKEYLEFIIKCKSKGSLTGTLFLFHKKNQEENQWIKLWMMFWRTFLMQQWNEESYTRMDLEKARLPTSLLELCC